METIVFFCEDTIEGILTGVYDAWEEAISSGLGHTHCRLETRRKQTERCLSSGDADSGESGGGVFFEQMALFSVRREVLTDLEKARKVIRTLRKRLGENVYEHLCYAMASREADKAETVYKTIVAGLSMKQGRNVFDKVTDPYVARCFDLMRNVSREMHRELEFLRFQEMENGVLFAKIHPKNDVLMYLGTHFSDRLPLENFLIYDINRQKALFHEKQKDWYLMDVPEMDFGKISRINAQEDYYQELFCLFCHAISIQGRENRTLQRQLLPLYFRDVMPEFMKWQTESLS